MGFDKREWSYVLFEGLDEPPSAHWFGEFILPKHWIPPNLELSTQKKKFIIVMWWAFLQYWVGLPPVVFDPNILSKRVGTGLIVTHFGPACAQTMPNSPVFNNRPIASRTIVSKL